MANQNFFALLEDDENEDPTELIARAGAAAPVPSKGAKQQQSSAPALAKLPTKPRPPSQAVRDAQAEAGRGRGGRLGGRGGFGNRDRNLDGNYNRPARERRFQGTEQTERSPNNYQRGGETAGILEERGRQVNGGGRGGGRGRGRGYGFIGDAEERPRQREYDRRSGTGRGHETKRDGSGRGNWGTETEHNDTQEVLDAGFVEEEKPAVASQIVNMPQESQAEVEDAEKKNETEEDKDMTLDEYERLLTEKRKSLEALKLEERKVTLDKDFESMQLVEKKNEEVFLKLGMEKAKKKDTFSKDEKSRKPLNINEFLKPADGEYLSHGRRGRGGGRARGGGRGGYSYSKEAEIAPSIEDPNQFPVLGGK